MHSTAPPSTILRDRFLADHHEFEDLLVRLLAAFEANDRERVGTLWTEFADRVTKHLEAEERFVIPQLFSSRPRDARTILEEHRHIRSRLGEFGLGVDPRLVRLERARGFVDELRAHARYEDDVLYRWADEHLAPAEQSTLFAALTAPLRNKQRSR